MCCSYYYNLIHYWYNKWTGLNISRSYITPLTRNLSQKFMPTHCVCLQRQMPWSFLKFNYYYLFLLFFYYLFFIIIVKADYSLASPPILTILPLLDGLLTGKLPLSGEKETRQFLAATSLKNRQNIA